MTSSSDRRLRLPARLLTAATVGLTLLLAACSSAANDGPNDVFAVMSARQRASQQAQAVQTGAAATSTKAPGCNPAPDASYPPLSSLSTPGGSYAAAIRAKGQLVVGVSGDTRLLGYRDALDEGNLKGFDIELAKAVGRAIFGTDGKVQFTVITAAQRFSSVNTGQVDLVARAVSMTCDRWTNPDDTKSALFSAGYFRSAQRLLVRSDLQIASIDKLPPGSRVCAPAGSTSLANLARYPNVAPASAEIHSDCLALWQEGRVDAITGDDAILAGFAVQDPHAAVVGGSLDTTSYAFAIGKSHPDFVQFVNAVMVSPAFRATWARAYQTYLAGPLGAQTQPEPNYSRPLPAR